MKIRVEHIRSLRKDMRELNELQGKLNHAISNWLGLQGGPYDDYYHPRYRTELEQALDKYRTKIGEIYDLMSERGLRSLP